MVSLNCSIIQTQHIKLLFLDSDYAESAAKILQKSCFAKYSTLFYSFAKRKLFVSFIFATFEDSNIIDMKILFRIVLAVCFLSCTVSCGRKRITSIDGGSVRVAAMTGDSGAVAVRAILERSSVMVDSIKRPVLGYASHALEKYMPESPLMNFAADALLLMARERTGRPVDVAITNKGGLRSNIQAGDVTFGDVYNVFPFENTLALLTLNGEQLLQLCAEIASVGGEAISGMRLVITPEGGLVSATVGGEPISRSRNYLVATSDFLSQGNDRMTTLALGADKEIMSGITIRDIMVQYITGLSARGVSLSAACDGRITIKE